MRLAFLEGIKRGTGLLPVLQRAPCHRPDHAITDGADHDNLTLVGKSRMNFPAVDFRQRELAFFVLDDLSPIQSVHENFVAVRSVGLADVRLVELRN